MSTSGQSRRWKSQMPAGPSGCVVCSGMGGGLRTPLPRSFANLKREISDRSPRLGQEVQDAGQAVPGQSGGGQAQRGWPAGYTN